MLVTRRLGEENTPDVITQKIHRKVRELADMLGIDMPAAEQPSQTAADTAPAAPAVAPPVFHEEKTATEEAPSSEGLPEEDYDADETWQHDNGEEFKEVFALDYKEPEHQVPVSEREPDKDISLEFIMPDDEPDNEEPAPEETSAATVVPPPFHPEPVEATSEPKPEPEPVSVPEPAPAVVEDSNDEPVPEPDPNVLPEDDRNLDDITVEFIEADDEELPEPVDEQPIPPVPTDFPEVEEPTAPLRVDEKLQRTMTKDIRTAFSVNDRFRFQRELFAGSANALDTAIEHILAMRSYGNAELYFYSQLHWDREDAVVQDFMSIVRNHFQK